MPINFSPVRTIHVMEIKSPVHHLQIWKMSTHNYLKENLIKTRLQVKEKLEIWRVWDYLPARRNNINVA